MLGLEAPIGSGSAQAVSGMVDGFALTYTRKYVKPCVARLADPSPWNWTHLFD